MIVRVIDPNSRIKVGTYVLDNTRIKNHGNYYPESGVEFDPDAHHTGVLHINSIDRIKKRIAGTFYFKAQNPVTGEVVDVSDGKLNARYLEY